jgi:hypothetical protein
MQHHALLGKQGWAVKYLALASLAAFVMLISIREASAVVCARGVYRAGCVGPRGAVVAIVDHMDAYTWGEEGTTDLPSRSSG